MSDYPRHAVPCPLHPESQGSPSGVCRKCMSLYMKHRRLTVPDNPSLLTRYKTARYLAEYRGIPFTLTFEQYQEIVESPCVYKYGRKNVKSGIDRRDSSQGYLPENSQPCCARHNLMKSDFLTHDQMLDAVKRYSIQCGAKAKRKSFTR